MRKTFLLILSGIIALNAIAGQKPYADKELMGIMAWLKQADGYSYQVNIVSRMKADTAKKQEQEISIYSSGSDFIRYISSKEDISFMNKNGFFKAVKTRKEGIYKQFTSDSMAQRAFAAISAADAGKLADSILLDRATISSKENRNGVLHYRLSYAPGYMIKELEIFFDTHRKEIISVAYSMERPVGGVRQEGAMNYQKVFMSHYKHTAPPEIELLVRESVDLKKYMHAVYPEYQIHNL